MRDEIVDFVRRWSEKTEISAGRFIQWLGGAPSKFYSWRRRPGSLNGHNGWVPRDFWLEEWGKRAMLEFYREHPLEGYRWLTYMLLDTDIVAVSSSSVWRVLSRAIKPAQDHPWNAMARAAARMAEVRQSQAGR